MITVKLGTHNGEDVTVDFTTDGHLFIHGGAGCGKSELARDIVNQIVDKDDVKITILDCKRFNDNWNPDTSVEYETVKPDRDGVREFKRWEDSLEFRQAHLAELNAASIDEYRNAGNDMSEEFLVIEEASELRKVDQITKVIQHILRVGRPLGVHLIYISQKKPYHLEPFGKAVTFSSHRGKAVTEIDGEDTEFTVWGKCR